MITLITLAGVVEGGPQEYKRVKGGDTMANIKRTKLVLRFNTTACPTWSASMKYP